MEIFEVYPYSVSGPIDKLIDGWTRYEDWIDHENFVISITKKILIQEIRIQKHLFNYLFIY